MTGPFRGIVFALPPSLVAWFVLMAGLALILAVI